MHDLRERFQSADRMDTPDLWEEVVSRSRSVGQQGEATPPVRGMAPRITAGIVAMSVFAGAALLLWLAFIRVPSPVDRPGSSDSGAPPSASEPLVISIHETTGPPYEVTASASFGGETIDLEGIETPGDELGYPTAGFSTPIPVGTPIEVRGDAESVRVRELVPDGPGDLVDVRAERLPGDLSVVEGAPRKIAFGVYAEFATGAAEWGFTFQLVDPDAVTDGQVIAEGIAHGAQWTLLLAGGDAPVGLQLQWDEPEAGAESIEPRTGIVVGWHVFGRFEPDDSVIFGVVPDEVVAVKHEPGQGLPVSNVSVIDVPGAAWNAFVFSSYSATGIVKGLGPNDVIVGERLIVPSGCEGLRLFAEAFLAARRAGEGAETFLAPGVVDQFGHQGVGPLYAESDGGSGYGRSKVLFLDGPYYPGAGCETGVRLEADDGTVSEETLFIRYRDGAPIIDGLRGGTTGP